MKDVSDTQSFWGKQKPIRHYIHHGVLRFKVKGQHLLYAIIMIEKERRAPLFIYEVKDKEHLKRLLSTKTLREVLA